MPVVADIQRTSQFFNSLTSMGTYYANVDEEKVESVKTMSYSEKIDSVKLELKSLLDLNNKDMSIISDPIK